MVHPDASSWLRTASAPTGAEASSNLIRGPPAYTSSAGTRDVPTASVVSGTRLSPPLRVRAASWSAHAALVVAPCARSVIAVVPTGTAERSGGNRACRIERAECDRSSRIHRAGGHVGTGLYRTRTSTVRSRRPRHVTAGVAMHVRRFQSGLRAPDRERNAALFGPAYRKSGSARECRGCDQYVFRSHHLLHLNCRSAWNNACQRS